MTANALDKASFIRRSFISIASACVFASTVHAQTQAPGLWEHSFTMSSSNGEAELAIAVAQQKLASLPPEQRRQIEQMMAKNGIRLSAGGTTTVQACLAPNDAQKPPQVKLPGDCQQSNVKQSANSLSFQFTCSKPQPSSGSGEISFLSNKAYQGHADIATQIAGQSKQLTLELRGQWVAADCGAVSTTPAPFAR